MSLYRSILAYLFCNRLIYSIRYETKNPIVGFTEAQLAEIRKITLAKTICDNIDGNSDMQRAAFELPSNFLNPR